MTAPDILSRISDLELVARLIVEGLVSGLHRSPFHGYSAEFSQYRHYQPGDDLKYVDWKLAARTDRVYTKQFRETTNMPAMLVLDASASMAFPVGRSKHRYAASIAAALAHVLARQGDAVGVVAAGGSREFVLPPRAGRPHASRVIAALASQAVGGAWKPAAAIQRAAERLKRRGMLIVLSDFYDDEEQTFAELRRAGRVGHDVMVLHVISREEVDLPYRRDLELVDLETGRTAAVHPDAARQAYAAEVSAFLDRCRRRAIADGFQYALLTTDTPPERALRMVLLARS